MDFVSGWVENIVEKGENCSLGAFSPYPTMFQKSQQKGSKKQMYMVKVHCRDMMAL